MLTLDELKNTLVDVYWNKTRRLYSVRPVQTGQVLGHIDQIQLRFCYLRVSKKVQSRMRRTGKSIVHSWVRGIAWGTLDPNPLFPFNDELVYDPFTDDGFVSKKYRVPMISPAIVFCRSDKGQPIMDFNFALMDMFDTFHEHEKAA